MCESVGKADLLSDHLDSKQSRECADLSPSLMENVQLVAGPTHARG